MPKNKADSPLEVKVTKDQVVISVGINTLKFCAEMCPRFYDYDKFAGSDRECGPYVTVENKRELANDFRRELLREEEDGTTPLHILFDECIVRAFEDGSLGFAEESWKKT